MTIQNKRLLGISFTVVLLLLIPLVAMQFTAEVNWNAFDFLVAGILLLGTGLSVEFILRKFKKPAHRIMIIGVILLALLVIWAELAVGIFGTPLAGS